jgi:hypothetical protein
MGGHFLVAKKTGAGDACQKSNHLIGVIPFVQVHIGTVKSMRRFKERGLQDFFRGHPF